MATNTIIQYLETGVGVEAMNRRQVETYLAAEAITAKDVLALDITQTEDGDKMIHVVKADGNDADRKAFVGVALTDAASGETVDVCVAGICEAKTDGSVTKGSALSLFDTNPGEFKNYAAADTLPAVAYACEDDTADVATVMVIKQF